MEERRMFQALSAETIGRFHERQLWGGTVAADDDDCDHVENARGAPAPHCEAPETQIPVRAGAFSPHSTDHHDSGEARVARASCAVLASVVAGSLCGVALKRITLTVAGSVGAIVIGAQVLCWMGYATVEWGTIIRTCAPSVLQGYRPRKAEPKSHHALTHERVLCTLKAVMPRRASFWAGVVIGVALS
ncbi:hypothetical protein LSCM1_03907 [Leishmania martiniquensis]|uniref:Transmembrane protein n=1 Tax=Leishmania martiniquensis TaxID=1580590 RepID=A0A836KFV1_9TRYP|nr:hypothetical protein LSCM1_03907 [Leishmania martiniquensis]